MCAARSRQLFSAQHTCYLVHTFIGRYDAYMAGGSCVAALFGYDQVAVATGSNLRQVGDRQHLSVLSQCAHDTAYGIGNGATNARIYFVKDKCGCLAELAGRDRNGQRDPRQFAARCHFADGFGVCAGVAGNQQVHIVQAIQSTAPLAVTQTAMMGKW